MSAELVLFGLRILSSIVLILFVGMIGWMLWRDYQQAESAIANRTRPRGRLILLENAESSRYRVGQSWVILPLNSVGRAPNNTIQLNEPYISNEHAQLNLRGGQWWLEDLQSSNGTKLNEQRIEEPTIVAAEDEISFGRLRFRLELD